MRVFIDANIYLNFFERSNERIASLNTLQEYVQAKKATLIFPQITQDEFFRNLPSVKSKYLAAVSSAIKSLQDSHAKVDYLGFGKAASKKSKNKELLQELKSELGVMKEKYPSDCDKLVKDTIEPLISMASIPKQTDEVFERAKLRRLVGNPPGKSDARMHIGDELTWELILANYTDDDLVIVSQDNDWPDYSEDKSKRISSFLKREWSSKSGQKIELVGTLGEFVNKYLNPPKAKQISKEDIDSEKSSIMSPLSPSDILWINSPGVIQPATSTQLNSNIINSAYANSVLLSWQCSSCGNYNDQNALNCTQCGWQKSILW